MKLNKNLLSLEINRKSNEQLSLISSSLAETYKAGIPINEGIALIINSACNREYRESLKRILKDIKEGHTLSESCSKYRNLYSKFFTGMIAIGENSGKLYEVLRGLSIYYERCEFIKKEFMSAGIYPLFILTCLGALMLLGVNVIIPDFCDIYTSMNIELPSSCRDLYNLSIAFKNNIIFALCSIVCWGILLPFAVFKYLKCSFKVEILTRIKIVKDMFEYMLIIILAIVTSCGANISYSLSYCEEFIDSNYLRTKIHMINESIKKGSTLTEALESIRICSQYTLAIIKIKEESGNIESGFNELSDVLGKKINNKIKRYLKFIEPMLVLIMSVIIIIFLLVFFMPLFTNLSVGMKI